MADSFTVTILDDGSVKVETDDISAANHMSADAFMKFLAQELGGEVVKQKKPTTHHQIRQTQSQGG